MTLVAMVFVLDADANIRAEVREILRSCGIQSQGWETAAEFLASLDINAHGCLLLDERLPDMHGLQVQQTLRLRRSTLPIIMTGVGMGVRTAVTAVRNGALDVLEKPFSAEIVIDSVNFALRIAEREHHARVHRDEIMKRLAMLSAREREVLEELVRAKSTKEIAATLSVSPKTIDNHRASILKKLKVGSTIEVVRLLLADESIMESNATPENSRRANPA